MKQLRKFVSVVLALTMVMAMAATAFAADNNEYVIKINGNKDDLGTHSYRAYQIFAGDLADNADYKVLSCGEEAHIHETACYELVCADTDPAHVHGDGCYGQNIVCGKPEHVHEETCYAENKTQPKYVLSNIVWGSGISDKDALMAALKANEAFNEERVDGQGNTVTVNLFADCQTAADVAKVVSGFASSKGNNATLADDFAAAVSGFLSETEYFVNGNDQSGDSDTIRVNGAGYYMIKDVDGSLQGQESAAYTRLLLQVVGDAEVIVKSEVPSGDKKVFYQGKDAYANPDYAENFKPNENLGDANYAGIGDHVSFQVTSKVPNYTGYDYYCFIINDAMSEGLTFDGAASVTVKVTVVSTETDANGQVVEKTEVKTLDQGAMGKLTCTDTGADHVHGADCYEGTLVCKETESDSHTHTEECYIVDGDYFVYPDGDHSFRLAFADIMDYPVGSAIEVTYSATVNEDAVIGTSGNENAWSLDYSRDPNFDYEGTRDEKQPGLPMDEENTPLGETPEHKTLTYLTELDITKYANEVDPDNILGGAEFTLTGTSYQVVLERAEHFVKPAEGEVGTYYKLLDGSYTTEEPKKDEYISAGSGTESTEKGYLRALDGTYYVPTDKKEYVGKEVYKLSAGSAGLYASTTQKYVKKTAETTKLVPVAVSTTLTTDPITGKISFKGLGEGTYTLTETKTPAGYNTINPINFTVKFTPPADGVTDGSEECTWEITGWTTDENGNQTISNTEGIFAANIINVRGTLLPSTGGIGTTIFYAAGSVLVLAAVVLLVTKKRMTKEK